MLLSSGVMLEPSSVVAFKGGEDGKTLHFSKRRPAGSSPNSLPRQLFPQTGLNLCHILAICFLFRPEFDVRRLGAGPVSKLGWIFFEGGRVDVVLSVFSLS